MSLATPTVVGLDAPAAVGFGEKIWRINWGLALVLTAIAGIGVVALYSAAGGRFDPWAARHAVRYGVAFGLMLVVALMHPRSGWRSPGRSTSSRCCCWSPSTWSARPAWARNAG